MDLKEIINELQSVTDDDLLTELRKFDKEKLNAFGPKFHNAFSAYGLSNFLSGASLDVLRANTKVPDPEMNGIRWNGIFILRGYASMVYMRSYQLEKGLDDVSDSSPIQPFKKFFRAGSIKKGEDTVAQHIRNAFAHGSFELSDNMQEVTFKDSFKESKWEVSVKMSDFIDGLCDQVFRFYAAAFRAHQEAQLKY